MPTSIHSGSGGSVSGSNSLLKTVPGVGKSYLCEVTPENSGNSPGTGSGGVLLLPVTPGPTRDPSIPIPPGCPSSYPIKGSYNIEQGPGGSYSHIVAGGYPGEQLQAIDISQPGGLTGANVLSTAPGVVVFSGYYGDNYGQTVIIEGSCGGKNFVIYLAHLLPGSMVPVNTTVSAGQTIGLSDNSVLNPIAGNAHIHYEIRGCAPGENPLHCQGFETFQISDYIPVPIAPGCLGNCGKTQ